MFSGFCLPKKVLYFVDLRLFLKKSIFSRFFLCSSIRGLQCARAKKEMRCVSTHSTRIQVNRKKATTHSMCEQKIVLAFCLWCRTIQPDLKTLIFWVLYGLLNSFFEQSCVISLETLWTSKENLKSTIKCQKLIFLHNFRKFAHQFCHNFPQRHQKITKLAS